MANRLQILIAAYQKFVDRYRENSGALPAMMQLKLDHTMRVLAHARAIADGENFSAHEKEICEAAALLHDTGRYEQLKRYNTFRDSESVDHAAFSVDMIIREKWLDTWSERDAILTAVREHNRREISRDTMDALTLLVSRVVRDADKLDIFTVLENQVATTDWRKDSRAFWNLATTKAPNPIVLACVRDGRPVDYQDIQSLADFVLIQVGWMIAGLEFATARKICHARKHLAFRREFLREISAGDEADDICDLAEKKLQS